MAASFIISRVLNKVLISVYATGLTFHRYMENAIFDQLKNFLLSTDKNIDALCDVENSTNFTKNNDKLIISIFGDFHETTCIVILDEFINAVNSLAP